MRSLLPNLYSKEKLLLAFEYGMTLSKVAKDLNLELTFEQMDTAEDLILREFKENSPTQIAQDMLPNLLAILGPQD